MGMAFSVTRFIDFLLFGQAFKAGGINYCTQIVHFWATFMDIWRFFTGHTEGIQQSLMQISYTILPHLRRLSWFNLGQSFTCNPDNDSVSLVTSLWPRIIPICCRQLTSVWKNVATRNAIKGPLFSSSSMIY